MQQFLVPILRPGDLVVLDNVSSHKIADVCEAIEAARTVGALCNAIGHLLARFSSGECADYFANAEYRLPIRETR